MTQITDLVAEDSGLDAAYADVRELEIDDTALGSGGFGTVYPCRSVNGMPPPSPLAIKILQDDGTGSDTRGFQTVGELQGRIREANQGRGMRGEPPLQTRPAFMGLPLIRIKGKKNGQDVYGYATYRLDTAGYVPFDTVTDGMDPTLRTEYLRLPPDTRLRLASDLAEAFAVLGQEMGYVHGDLNAPNLWVNLTTGRLTVIDFDGGGIISGSGTQPTTFGKLGDWLAPEILEALARGGPGSPVPVNLQTDAWSVAVGISYLLWLCHPLLFLERLGKDALTDYFTMYRWPEIQRGDPNFNRDNDALYDWFVDQVRQLNTPVRQAFETSLQEGAFDPARRISAAKWQQALLGQGTPPIIHLFEADPPVSSGTSVVLRWWVEGAQEVEIAPGLGRVNATQSRLVFPTTDTLYTLTARGLFGTSTAMCSVQIQSGPGRLTPGVPGSSFPSGTAPHLRQIGFPLLQAGLRMLANGPGSAQRRVKSAAGMRSGTVLLPAMPAFPWRSLYRRLDAIFPYWR